MRPYRKVDMGTELESHHARLTNLERLEAQLRGFQAIAGMLLIFVVGTAWKDCQAEQQERMDQKVIENNLRLHTQQPHNVHADAVEAVQQTLKEHDDRIANTERRLKIKR